MAEYIDRKALLDELCRDNCERTYDGTCHNCRMTDTIANFPTADVAEVRHGRWEYIAGTANTYSRLRCNCCGWWTLDPSVNSVYHFCPNCGTRMDKEDEHEAD
jgi:predicted RNA-binding Zn-ribbon protein involved in translation (DUF1610 family)